MSALGRSKDSMRSGLPEDGPTADRADRATFLDQVYEADARHSLRVALVGYGEVGGIVGRALRKHSLASLRTYDRLFDDAARRGAILQRAGDDGVDAATSAAAAVVDADIVFSAVTAAETSAVVQAVASELRHGAFYIDLNSASPRTKREGAAAINAAGGRYVEMAVMAPVAPYGVAVPMFSGGPHAAAIASLLATLGFKVTPASEHYGVASAIKMCRSVVVKGMEAIVVESFLTARHYGVEQQVLPSLAETFPGLDWEKLGDYFFRRVIQHGQRRAEEMREAAETVRDAGQQPWMAGATAERQEWLAAFVAARDRSASQPDARWRDWADWVAQHLMDDR